MANLAFVRNCKSGFAGMITGQQVPATVLQRGLFAAARRDRREIVEILLDRGADLKSFNARGRSALALAIMNNAESTALYLIEKQRDIGINEPVNRKKETALHVAVESGNLKLIQAVLLCGGDVNVFSKSENALLVAVRARKLEAAKLVLRQAPNMNATAKGNTALHIACRNQDIEMVRILLAAGARAFVMNRRGQIPSSLANAEIRKLLQEFPMKQKKAREQVLTLLAIKKFRRENLVAFVPKDVVNLIARIVWEERLAC